jgi:hypothetical protein
MRIVKAGRRGRTVIEHRIHQKLCRDVDLAAVVRQLSQRCGQSAASTRPADRDARGVHRR